MRNVLRSAALAGLVVLGAAGPVRAAEGAPAESGFEIAFRSGVLIPVGNLSSGSKLKDAFGLQFPLWVDLGYRWDKYFVGAYGQYAFGLVGGQVDCGPATCSAGAFRAGFELQMHPNGRGSVDPWLGIGFGYEWDMVHESMFNGATYVTGSVTVHGWDIARIGAGVDFALTRGLHIGPFVEATVSEFVKAGVSFPNYEYSNEIPSKAVHSWISIGVKITGLL